MPDSYVKYPRPESIRFFEQAMRNHNIVDNFRKLDESYYEITRHGMPKIRVFVSNYYALSLSDYYDIKDEYQDIDCLITISNWNRVTDEAYTQGKSNRVGVFTMREFLGAINIERPYIYIRPIDREDNDRIRKSV